MDTGLYISFALSALAALAMICLLAYRAWGDWLAYKRYETDSMETSHIDQGTFNANYRIDLADLKERVRKLEAIAAGVEY